MLKLKKTAIFRQIQIPSFLHFSHFLQENLFVLKENVDINSYHGNFWGAGNEKWGGWQWKTTIRKQYTGSRGPATKNWLRNAIVDTNTQHQHSTQTLRLGTHGYTPAKRNISSHQKLQKYSGKWQDFGRCCCFLCEHSPYKVTKTSSRMKNSLLGSRERMIISLRSRSTPLNSWAANMNHHGAEEMLWTSVGSVHMQVNSQREHNCHGSIQIPNL